MKTTLLSISFLVTAFFSSAQTVSTVLEGDFFDDLAQDQQGNLYGSDYNGNTIYKYDTNGVVSIFKDGFSNPNGIGFNSQNEMYICDHTANTIFKYDTDGTLLETYTGILTPSGVKNIPGTDDMIYVEYGTSRVGKLAPDGSTTILYAGDGINGPAGIAFIDDVLYVSNYNDRKILKLENSTVTTIAQLPAEANNNNFLGFIDAKDGYIYATSLGGHKIYKIDPSTGDYFSWAGSTHGSEDGFIWDATFCFPNGILFDNPADRLYISEAGTDNLRIIDGVSLGLEELFMDVNTVQIAPNPATDYVGITSSEQITLQYSVEIHDALGRLVFEKETNKFPQKLSEKIDISTFSQGAYYVTIISDGRSVTKKVIK